MVGQVEENVLQTRLQDTKVIWLPCVCGVCMYVRRMRKNGRKENITRPSFKIEDSREGSNYLG